MEEKIQKECTGFEGRGGPKQRVLPKGSLVQRGFAARMAVSPRRGGLGCVAIQISE
jgi:hypothetical protein